MSKRMPKLPKSREECLRKAAYYEKQVKKADEEMQYALKMSIKKFGADAMFDLAVENGDMELARMIEEFEAEKEGGEE